MTRWWRDLRTVTTVGVLLAAVVGAFPYESLNFKGREVPRSRPASAAFVRLSTDEEEAALRAAKSAWQSESSAMQRMRIRLPLGELPEDDDFATLEFPVEERYALETPDPLAYPPPAYAPSSAAPPRAKLVAEPDSSEAMTFSREDLLGI